MVIITLASFTPLHRTMKLFTSTGSVPVGTDAAPFTRVLPSCDDVESHEEGSAIKRVTPNHLRRLRKLLTEFNRTLAAAGNDALASLHQGVLDEVKSQPAAFPDSASRRSCDDFCERVQSAIDELSLDSARRQPDPGAHPEDLALQLHGAQAKLSSEIESLREGFVNSPDGWPVHGDEQIVALAA